VAAVAFSATWVAVLAVSRAYERRFIGMGAEEFGRVLRAGATLLAIVALLGSGTNAPFSRAHVVLTIPVTIGVGLLGRYVLRLWLARQRRLDRCVQRTVILGSAAGVAAAIARLRAGGGHGMTFVGACLSERDAAGLTVPVLGDIADAADAVRIAKADVLLVLPDARMSGGDLRRLAWQMEDVPAEVLVVPGLPDVRPDRIAVRSVAGDPVLHVSPARLSGPARLVKGSFDRSAALIGLIMLSPLLIGVAVSIWAADRHAPVFRHERIGIDGRPFVLYKFRTMVPGADARQTELMAASGSSALLFKVPSDPRVTPLGRWLRRSSLDELPQLWNVVRGDMSLVGPRPQVAAEVAEYSRDMRRRLRVKPGITGLWQVSGRSKLSTAEAERLDVRYVENWSLGTDLLILLRSVRAVISGSGAY
jgi:exopolysaccharide biosynthesis polyprenyl glycosylphosphotransferase